MKTASLIRTYGQSRNWERAGLYWLSEPLSERLRDGSIAAHEYVLVRVLGDTADMVASDHKGRVDCWIPLKRADMEPRGEFMVERPSCTGALEAEGYTVVGLGEVTK